MLDINHIRAELAAHLADKAHLRHSLDAAVMHVVQLAYQQGMHDGQITAYRRAADLCAHDGAEWDSDNLVTEKNYAAHCGQQISQMADELEQETHA
jgi:dissimilatory sulfite reductase (desulfoviridin) alpha/beta subunit